MKMKSIRSAFFAVVAVILTALTAVPFAALAQEDNSEVILTLEARFALRGDLHDMAVCHVAIGIGDGEFQFHVCHRLRIAAVVYGERTSYRLARHGHLLLQLQLH